MATKKKLLQSTAGDSYWIALLGNSGDQYGRAVAADSSGNIIMGGYTGSVFSPDGIVAKYDPSGTLLWSRQLSGNEPAIYSIAVDSSDNIIVAGATGSQPTDAILVKYDSSGTLQWQRALGDGFSSSLGSGAQTAEGVAIDSSDNIIIVGRTYDSGAYLLVAKYDSSGTLQWDKQQGSGIFGDTYGRAVAIDSSDNIYAVGSTSVSTAGGSDLLVAKYNSSGTLQWDKKLGGSSNDFGFGIAIDSSDDVCVVGSTSSDGAGGSDLLVAKYNSSGTLQWDRTLGTSTTDAGYGITTDAFDNLIVVGTVSIGGAVGYQGLIAKYNSSGTLQWNRTLGGAATSEADYLYAATVDPSNNIIVSGFTGSDGAGNRDFIVAKLPLDGSGEGTYGSLAYEDVVLTDAAAVLTAASASLSVGSTSLTDAAGSLTDSAISLTEELFEVIA